jgi:AraC-like DNA-binding protein
LLTTISLYKGLANEHTPLLEDIIKYSAEELLNTGNRYLRENSVDTALMYYIALAGKYTPSLNSRDKNYAIQGYVKTGNIYYEQNIYHTALDFYFKALRICESEGFKTWLPQLYINTGNIYRKFKDYEKVGDCYQKGLIIAQETENREMEWKLLINLVGYSCINIPDSTGIVNARKYHEQAKQLLLPSDTLQRYYNLFNEGYIYYCEKNYDSAAVYYKKVLDFAVNNGMEPMYISSSSSALAFLYEDLEQYDRALEYHLFSNETVQHEDSRSEITMLSLFNLSVIYEKTGDDNRSLFYRNQYLNLSDSLLNIMEFNRVKNMQMVYEMDKINQKIDSLNAEKEKNEIKIRKQTVVLYFVSTGLCFIITLLVITWIQKQKLQSAYIGLFDRNIEILESDRINRNVRAEYERKLELEKAKTLQLQDELKQLGHKAAERKTVHDEKSETDASKHCMLTSEQKTKLLHDINNVMDNTLEYCNCEFNQNRLATLIGSNTKYVSLIINEIYSKNFRAYINEYRIKEASRRLMNSADYGHYTITAIAESVGFKSPTTFIATFKKITGINPSIWQKIAQSR